MLASSAAPTSRAGGRTQLRVHLAAWPLIDPIAVLHGAVRAPRWRPVGQRVEVVPEEEQHRLHGVLAPRSRAALGRGFVARPSGADWRDARGGGIFMDMPAAFNERRPIARPHHKSQAQARGGILRVLGLGGPFRMPTGTQATASPSTRVSGDRTIRLAGSMSAQTANRPTSTSHIKLLFFMFLLAPTFACHTAHTVPAPTDVPIGEETVRELLSRATGRYRGVVNLPANVMGQAIEGEPVAGPLVSFPIEVEVGADCTLRIDQGPPVPLTLVQRNAKSLLNGLPTLYGITKVGPTELSLWLEIPRRQAGNMPATLRLDALRSGRQAQPASDPRDELPQLGTAVLLIDPPPEADLRDLRSTVYSRLPSECWSEVPVEEEKAELNEILEHLWMLKEWRCLDRAHGETSADSSWTFRSGASSGEVLYLIWLPRHGKNVTMLRAMTKLVPCEIVGRNSLAFAVHPSNARVSMTFSCIDGTEGSVPVSVLVFGGPGSYGPLYPMSQAILDYAAPLFRDQLLRTLLMRGR